MSHLVNKYMSHVPTMLKSDGSVFVECHLSVDNVHTELIIRLIFIILPTTVWLSRSMLMTALLSTTLRLARLIEISVNRSIYNRKTIIDMKIKKICYF